MIQTHDFKNLKLVKRLTESKKSSILKIETKKSRLSEAGVKN